MAQNSALCPKIGVISMYFIDSHENMPICLIFTISEAENSWKMEEKCYFLQQKKRVF